MIRVLSLLVCFVLAFGCATDYSQKTTEHHRYIPPNSSLVLMINDLGYLRDSISNNFFLRNLNDKIPLAKVLPKIELLQIASLSAKCLLVFTPSGEVLYIGETAKENPNDSTATTPEKLFTPKEGSILKHSLEGADVYATRSNSVVLVASEKALISAALLQAEQKPNPIFKKLYATSNERLPLNLLFSLHEQDTLLSQIFGSETTLDLKSFGKWMSLDLASSPSELRLEGIAVSDTSVTDFLGLFKNTAPLPNTAAGFAPSSSDAILSYSFADFERFSTNRQHYTSLQSTQDPIFNAVEEVGVIFKKNKKAVVLNTYGSETLSDFLGNIRQNGYEYQGNPIFKLTQTDFLNMSLTPLVTDFNAGYYTILDNAFLFSPHKELLEESISAFKNGNTFDRSPAYTLMSERIASTASILFVGNASYMQQLLDGQLMKDAHTKGQHFMFKGNFVTAQLVAEGDFFLTDITVRQKDGTLKEPLSKPITIALEDEFSMTPQLVLNHTDKSREIVVQDNLNRLYLISEKGEILWKKQLDGQIQGRIHQVDLFKNGRLQLAFTTDRQLIVLDRNGKSVDGLSRSFEGGNLNPLAVFDYENNKEYRFVVTQGERIFMFDRAGKDVSGFTYRKAKSPVIGTPQHLVIGNKDHIVFQLADGSLKILSRTGKVRVPVSKKFEFSGNPVFMHKDRFTFSDAKGVLHQIAPNGEHTRTDLSLNTDHGSTGSQNSLVYQNDNELHINGKTITLDLGIYTVPKLFSIKDELYVSVTDIQNQNTYLFDNQGRAISDFPVYGNGSIALSTTKRDSKLLLAVKKDSNTLLLYRLGL